METKIKLLLSVAVLLITMLACAGGGDSLNPGGGATVTTSGDTIIYKYPKDDSMNFCMVKDGVYYCESK